MGMCIFTYMSPRLDVGVYIGRTGTQSLHVGVSVVAYIHTEFTCGYKCLYVSTYIHTEFTHLCVYILTYIQTEFTCVCAMESGGSSFYASCGGGFMQPITVRSL